MRRKRFYVSQRVRLHNIKLGSVVIGRFPSRDTRDNAFNDNRLWERDCFRGMERDENGESL